jgi:hypothetical protein
LNLVKIDLKQIIADKHRCYFESIEELITSFFTRYSL